MNDWSRTPTQRGSEVEHEAASIFTTSSNPRLTSTSNLGGVAQQPHRANSPSLMLLLESEKILLETEQQSNPFLSRPLFTATKLASRSSKGALDNIDIPQQPSPPPPRSQQLQPLLTSTRDGQHEPVTTTIFTNENKKRTASFPALLVRAEQLLQRENRSELVQQAAQSMEGQQPVAPSTLDTEDVDILKNLHSAAVGLATSQSGVREATRKLMAVCTDQQHDIETLKRHVSEIDLAIHESNTRGLRVEESARTTGLRVEDCASQINAVQLEVSHTLSDVKLTMHRVLGRMIKTTLLTNNEACLRLQTSSDRALLQRYMSTWARHGRARRVAITLLKQTQRGLLLSGWMRWRCSFLPRRRRLRQATSISVLSTKTGLLSYRFSVWRRFLKLRHTKRLLCNQISSKTDVGLRANYFTKWLVWRKSLRARESVYAGLAAMLRGSHTGHARWRFATWRRCVHERKVRRRSTRVALVLSSSNDNTHRRLCFRKWLNATLDRSNKRSAVAKMSVSTQKYFLLRYVRAWYEFRRDRHLDRRIQRRVSHLEAQLDLALAAVAKSSEVMTSILERQVELEAQLLQLGATKASIRQLRPEAFRGSLIDLDHHADSSPRDAVRNVAQQAVSSSHALNTTAGAHHQPPHHTDVRAELDGITLFTKQPPVTARNAPDDVVSQWNGLHNTSSLNIAPHHSSAVTFSSPSAVLSSLASPPSLSSGGRQPHHGKASPVPSVSTAAADPLQALAKHYGVSAAGVQRRKLPDESM